MGGIHGTDQTRIMKKNGNHELFQLQYAESMPLFMKQAGQFFGMLPNPEVMGVVMRRKPGMAEYFPCPFIQKVQPFIFYLLYILLKQRCFIQNQRLSLT
jgi:hypothetical protein